jgi:hypothetical protein
MSSSYVSFGDWHEGIPGFDPETRTIKKRKRKHTTWLNGPDSPFICWIPDRIDPDDGGGDRKNSVYYQWMMKAAGIESRSCKIWKKSYAIPKGVEKVQEEVGIALPVSVNGEKTE